MNARTFDELVAANALMRLTVEEGEQPIDRYLRYRDDMSQWDTDMDSYGLTTAEKDVLKEHLNKFYGICYSQESLMALSMDSRITGFNLIEANKLRKSIAKKDHKLYEVEHDHFFKQGEKLGTSKNLLQYVWDNCAEPAKFYSYNLAHGTTYTLILMIEMNICFRYGSIYWQTACLSVNSGIYGDEFKNTDYAKLTKAIGEMPGLVENPTINNSDYGFKPHNGKIAFGLYPIIGIGKEDGEKIIEGRPYNGIDDFVAKTELSDKKMVALIKAGAFDEFNNNRRQVMIDFVSSINMPKDKLTMVQLDKVRDAVPDSLKKFLAYSDFRSLITGRHKVAMTNEISTLFFDEFERQITEQYGKCYEYVNGTLKIDVKVFDKWFKKAIKPLSEWLKTEDATKAEASYRRREFWIENCKGNTASWEMEALGFYNGIHELTLTNIAEKYRVAEFNNLPSIPKIVGWSSYRRKQFPVYQHDLIYGTVIDKDKDKGLVYLLTPDGIANVRVGKQRFKKYNKRISAGTGKERHVVDDSWFKRGTKLLCVGYRRDKDFMLNNKDTGYEQCLMRIDGYGKHATVVSGKVA